MSILTEKFEPVSRIFTGNWIRETARAHEREKAQTMLEAGFSIDWTADLPVLVSKRTELPAPLTEVEPGKYVGYEFVSFLQDETLMAIRTKTYLGVLGAAQTIPQPDGEMIYEYILKYCPR